MSQFNIQRLILLIRRQIILNKKSWLMAATSIIGVFILISVIVIIHNDEVNEHYFYPRVSLLKFTLTALFLAGLIFTSKSLSELHSSQKAPGFLTLPASNLEKLLSIWLLTGPGFILFSTLTVLLIRIIAFGFTPIPYSLEEGESWLTFHSTQTAMVYLLIQPVVLLGAVSFKSKPLLKTILTLLTALLTLGLFTAGLIWLLFGASRELQDAAIDFSIFIDKFHFKQLLSILSWIWAPFFMLVAYFKLKERQV
jgi:hypothetical protein